MNWYFRCVVIKACAWEFQTHFPESKNTDDSFDCVSGSICIPGLVQSKAWAAVPTSALTFVTSWPCNHRHKPAFSAPGFCICRVGITSNHLHSIAMNTKSVHAKCTARHVVSAWLRVVIIKYNREWRSNTTPYTKNEKFHHYLGCNLVILPFLISFFLHF